MSADHYGNALRSDSRNTVNIKDKLMPLKPISSFNCLHTNEKNSFPVPALSSRYPIIPRGAQIIRFSPKSLSDEKGI